MPLMHMYAKALHKLYLHLLFIAKCRYYLVIEYFIKLDDLVLNVYKLECIVK